MKTSWRYLCKTSWRCLEDILKTSSKRLGDVLKTPWRGLKDVLKTSWGRLEGVLKTSWNRLEDVLKTYGQHKYIGLDQDVLKASWRCLLKTKTKDVFKTSSSRRMFAGTNQIIQTPIPKLRQTSIISKKPCFLSEKLKTLTSSSYHRIYYFFWNFAHVFYLIMSTKGCFLISFRSWVINKSVKNECVETRSFLICANNSRSKQSKKNPAQPFADIGKKETCAEFQQIILNSGVAGARQNFKISRQNTWFLENNRALSKFLYRILHSLISIIKL